MNLVIRYFSAEGLPVAVEGLPTATSVEWTRAAYPWCGGVAFGLWCGHGLPWAWGPAGGRGPSAPDRTGPGSVPIDPGGPAAFN